MTNLYELIFREDFSSSNVFYKCWLDSLSSCCVSVLFSLSLPRLNCVWILFSGLFSLGKEELFVQLTYVVQLF